MTTDARTWLKLFIEARVAAGLSQSQLAKAAGVSRQAVSQWETCGLRPSADTYAKITPVLWPNGDAPDLPERGSPRRVADAALENLLRGQWLTVAQVAEAMGISTCTARGRLLAATNVKSKMADLSGRRGHPGYVFTLTEDT